MFAMSLTIRRPGLMRNGDSIVGCQPTGQTPPREWLAEVFARLEIPLLAYVTKCSHGRREIAQDVVQEAFVKLCQQAWPEIESHATAWLYRTCRNRAIDINRREGRMNHSNSTTDVTDLQDPVQQPADMRAEQGEQMERLRLELGKLPERQQEVLRLRLHDTLSYKQIAEITGLSVTNVGYHLHQAVASLRARIH